MSSKIISEASFRVPSSSETGIATVWVREGFLLNRALEIFLKFLNCFLPKGKGEFLQD